jgi:ABC-type Mn2+/Zn2+ transport system ATPase subunit
MTTTAGGSRARHEPHAVESPPVLAEASGLAIGYGGLPALRDVTFRARPGERIAVLGPNGGGKTTLFRALLGELRPQAGELVVRASCATVPQTERSRLDYPVSALDVALMGALPTRGWWRRPGRAGRARALDALERVGLAAHADDSFGELSGGQRQRVLIARALVQGADLMLLDEPFTGLDVASDERLRAVIDGLAREGRGVMVATHDIEQARRWDLVLCLNHRQVAFGEPSRTLTTAVLEATHGGAIIRLSPGDGPLAVAPPHHHGHAGADDAA